MSNKCVICNISIPEGRQICPICEKAEDNFVRTSFPAQLCDFNWPPKPNVELSFGSYDGNYDFLVNYRRAKPLNRFQIWMFKICFGIRAKNL